jgi:DNA-binding response OmpR family regulator
MSSPTSSTPLDALFAELSRTGDRQEQSVAQTEVAVRPRVLVIEDDPVIIHLIEHILSRKGFAVEVATDGRQAQALIETASPPSVIVLDVMLPFVGGFELVECIRSRQDWKRVPILMLTSKSQESYVVRAFGAGVDDYVIKPFRPEELVARVKRLAGA